MEDVSHDPRVGTVLQERYRILERLAVGSMGIVYRAERLLLGRPLAVKFLHASYAADPTFIQRFERETRVMGRLAHPHCVSVIDFGVDSGPYVVMEFVSGRTLRSLIEGGRLTIGRAVHITRQTLAGLAHAHSLGIIHRDIKPANIMLMEATGTGDHVCILDFGLATLREAPSDISHSAIVIGTPNYMSPEQSVGSKADVRSDVYSTGVVLFELLTGRKPFTSEDTFELLSMHRSAPVPRLDNVVPDTDFPPGLQEALDTALAKQPEDRFQTAMEFATALDEALEMQTAPAPVRPLRHATRPVAGDGSEPDYRRRLAAARESRARPRRRKRRRASLLFLSGLVLAVLGGAAWGGYQLWTGEVGAQLRALIQMPEELPALGGGADTGAGATDDSEPMEMEPERIGPVGEQPKEQPAEPTEPQPEQPAEPVKPEPATPPAGETAGSDPAEPDDGEPAGDAPPPVPAAAEVPAAGADVAGADDEIPAEPPLPPEERVEPVAPVRDSTAVVEGAEGDAAIKESAAARPVVVDSVAGAVTLIRAGKRDDAIQALIGLRRKMPKSAYVPYLLGHLYFEKGWWILGMDYYEAAIKNNGLYRGKRILNQNVIRALASKKTRKKATRVVVNTIGRQALPFLKQAVRTDRDAVVRDWSAWLVWRLNQLMRRGVR
jgi:hypothetical protein